MDSLLTATAASALPVIMVWAGAVDILTRAIPNRVTMTLAACFGLFAGASGLPLAEVAAHALCAIAVLAFGYFLYSQSWFGGGDAKLLAAAALWFGFDALLPFLAATALAGGVLSLAWLALGAAKAQFGLDGAQTRTIPYGAAMATGALAILPDWIAAF
jgi:prepilin peptidase CpaA